MVRRCHRGRPTARALSGSIHGVLLGNLTLVGFSGLGAIRGDQFVDMLAQLRGRDAVEIVGRLPERYAFSRAVGVGDCCVSSEAYQSKNVAAKEDFVTMPIGSRVSASSTTTASIVVAFID